MRLLKCLAGFAAALAVSAAAPASAAESVRLGVLELGAGNWVLSTLQRNELDR